MAIQSAEILGYATVSSTGWYQPYAARYADGQTRSTKTSTVWNMDHHRLGKIGKEMSGLLQQQQALLQKPFANLSLEDAHTYAERNQRLLDLSSELKKEG